MDLSRRIVWVPAVLVGACVALVAIRAAAGQPVHLIADITRPLNLESAAAVALLGVLIARARNSRRTPPGESEDRWHWVALGVSLLVTLGCYWRSLWFPLLSDDYVIVYRALHGELLPRVLAEGDAGVAFRPLTRFLFAVQGWGGTADPVWWHGIGLLFHAVNTALVYFLTRKLASPWASILAAAVFGLHALHPEAAVWMNSRSDVLATSFVLGALLLFVAHERQPGREKLAGALALVVLAISCKESAYAFAPLALLFALAAGGTAGACLRALIPFAAVEAAMFAWRWAVLGGLGGYAIAGSGQSMFLHISPVSALKALLWRAWALLYFPVNWEWPTGLALALAVTAAGGAMCILAFARPTRRAVLCCAGLVLVALLPVLPLALVGTDLNGARVYYLATVGAALLTGVAWDGLDSPRWRAAAAVCLLWFHLAALHHQLEAWESTATLTQRTCLDAASRATQAGGAPIVADAVPSSVHGVPFLSNGLPECVWLTRPEARPNILVNRPAPGGAAPLVLRWEPDLSRLVREGG